MTGCAATPPPIIHTFNDSVDCSTQPGVYLHGSAIYFVGRSSVDPFDYGTSISGARKDGRRRLADLARSHGLEMEGELSVHRWNDEKIVYCWDDVIVSAQYSAGQVPADTLKAILEQIGGEYLIGLQTR